LFLILFFLSPFRAVADLINLSGAENAPNIAEIHINENSVRIELEVFVKDIPIFGDLIPDVFFKDIKIKRQSLDDRLRHFSSQVFQIVDDNGRKLQAQLKVAEPRFRKNRFSPYGGKINPFTRRPIPGPPDDKRVFFVELLYPLEKKTESLTFIPPFNKNSGLSEVAIGFVTYHNQVLINDFRYLSEPSRLKLDWNDPWYSEFDKKALKRWQRGSVMSFLYIEPYEVRHEILARVKDLEPWIDLGLRGEGFIEADENKSLKQRVGEFFLQQDNVLIDGRKLKPILDRISFVKYARTGSTFLIQPEKLPIHTAVVGVIVTYVTKELPQAVTSEWSLWSNRIQKVPANAIDPAGPFPSYLTPDDNILTWTNYLKNYQMPTVAEIEIDESLTTMKIPLGSVLCIMVLVPLGWQLRKQKKNNRSIGIHLVLAVVFIAGSIGLYPFLQLAVAKPAVLAPKMTNNNAVSVLDSLLNNIYRSFDFREEEDIYDRLATSVSGDLLSEIYLQHRKSMVVSQAGGAQARVKAIEILDVDVSHHDDRGLSLLFHAKWTAMGSVGHWGHIHNRKNQYEADITVEPMDGAWKITQLELIEEKRIDSYAVPKA
jgi:hypothetical protein